jgi:hypothetical protein
METKIEFWKACKENVIVKFIVTHHKVFIASVIIGHAIEFINEYAPSLQIKLLEEILPWINRKGPMIGIGLLLLYEIAEEVYPKKRGKLVVGLALAVIVLFYWQGYLGAKPNNEPTEEFPESGQVFVTKEHPGRAHLSILKYDFGVVGDSTKSVKLVPISDPKVSYLVDHKPHQGKSEWRYKSHNKSEDDFLVYGDSVTFVWDTKPTIAFSK